MKKGFGKSMKGYSFKEFEKILNSYGFVWHHFNGKHVTFVSEDHRMLTVPYLKKELNHMMTTVMLQRIRNNHCRMFNRKRDINK